MQRSFIALLLCLTFFGCTRTRSEAPTVLDSINFSLTGNTVTAEYICPSGRIDFEKFNYEVVDENDKLLCVYLPLEYDPASRIIYGSAFVTATGADYRKKFVIAKGEMLRQKFTAVFPKETEFIVVRNEPVPFGYTDILKIKLPYSFEEIEWID